MKRVLLIVLITALSFSIAQCKTDDHWHQLRNLEKSNSYTVVLRDKTCRVGAIRKVQDNELAFHSGARILRSDVLIVGEGIDPHELLYSGRSSWEGVRKAQAEGRETLDVRLLSGKTISGAEIGDSQSSLTIKSHGTPVSISKNDVAWVDYIRFKPVSKRQRHFVEDGHGLQMFDPKVWQYMLKIDAMMSVRLYDSSLTEDNSPLFCPAEPQ